MIQDLVSTGMKGHDFIKVDSGMTELLRPSLYGAHHPMVLVKSLDHETSMSPHQYVVVGHCCESGDLMTPAPNAPEVLTRRIFPMEAAIGDLIVIEGTGAYCSSMSAKHYNSFPEAPELLLSDRGKFHIIRKRQYLSDIWANELPYKPL